MRSFGRYFELCFVCVTFAASVAPCGASVVLDAPGHAALEGVAVTARGGEPGAAWHIEDWLGREVEGAAGAFDERGETTLPPLKAGYYRLLGESQISNPKFQNSDCFATLAVVAPATPGGARGEDPTRPFPVGGASFFAADSAASYIAPGAFDCPWNGGDAIRTIADLAALAGIRHIRERMRWRDAQPSPDAPPDFSRCLAAADLFAAHGIALSGCFHDCPDWTGRLQKLPGDLAALYRFCRAAADAFGDRMEDWEFWNEPDIEFAPEPVWDYAAALKAAYLGFKAARPGMPVLNGALCRPPSSAYENCLFANDAAQYFDIFNYHTYSSLSQHSGIFAKMRESLNVAGADDRPVWITECGTNNEGPATEKSTRPGFTAHSPGQELVVAEYCAKANISLQMEGVARNYFFILGAYSERGGKKDWGMLRRDGTVKPAYAALATMILELGDARLMGRIDAPTGIRAYLYEQPDGSQTVAYWAESALDTVSSSSDIVEAEGAEGASRPLSELKLDVAAPLASQLRFVDMCGSLGELAPPDADGVLTLPATRYPAYVSGLRGLVADGAKAKRSDKERAEASAALSPSPIVFRVDLAPGDFEISGSKTLAVAKVEKPRLKVQIWNLSDVAQTGRVEAAGVALEGLPEEAVEIAPFEKVEFESALAATAARSESSSYHATLELHGSFNGREASRLSMPVLFEREFLASCEAVPLPWENPAGWERNDSAASYSATWDESEQAVRFDVEWNDPKTDRWFYPMLPLASQGGAQGAVRAVFEVKTEQDKVENDFKNNAAHLMLVRRGDAGSSADWLPYAPPTGSWERRYVELSTADGGLADVEAVRIGANPLGMRLTYWIRNVEILREKE